MIGLSIYLLDYHDFCVLTLTYLDQEFNFRLKAHINYLYPLKNFLTHLCYIVWCRRVRGQRRKIHFMDGIHYPRIFLGLLLFYLSFDIFKSDLLSFSISASKDGSLLHIRRASRTGPSSATRQPKEIKNFKKERKHYAQVRSPEERKKKKVQETATETPLPDF